MLKCVNCSSTTVYFIVLNWHLNFASNFCLPLNSHPMSHHVLFQESSWADKWAIIIKNYIKLWLDSTACSYLHYNTSLVKASHSSLFLGENATNCVSVVCVMNGRDIGNQRRVVLCCVPLSLALITAPQPRYWDIMHTSHRLLESPIMTKGLKTHAPPRGRKQ